MPVKPQLVARILRSKPEAVVADMGWAKFSREANKREAAAVVDMVRNFFRVMGIELVYIISLF